MATSSILTNVVIEDPKKAEAFVDALEKSSQDPVWKLMQEHAMLDFHKIVLDTDYRKSLWKRP